MELKQRQILIRIRPQRLAVLVDEHINREQIFSLIAFLSRIWGGRYSYILVVSEKDKGVNAKRLLSAIRPEVIFGVDIDRKKWAKTTHEISQPRSFSILNLNSQQIREFMRLNFEALIWADNIVWAEIRESPEMKRENLRLLKIQDNFHWSIFMAASFGLVPENKVAEYAEDLKADFQEFESSSDISLYLKTCTEMSKKWSWLDFANYRLNRHQIHTDATTFVPTIVVVDENEPISDIALFWNLRMQFSPGSSGRIILFSDKQIQNASSVEDLVNWIDSSPIKCNYCELVTKACKSDLLESLARRIRPRLKRLKSKIAHVDVKDLIQEIPLIIPYDKETQKRFLVSKKAVIIEDIIPFYNDYLPSGAAWICDLVKDSETGRLPYELCLPHRDSALQVLNAPDPPSIRLGGTIFGCGIDAINVLFTKNSQSISFRVPSAEELLEEMLIEAGVKPLKDEKRIRYSQTIDMFGDLSETAMFFSGISLRILEAFDSNKLTYSQIKGKAKLGKNKPKETSVFLDLTNRLPDHSKNIAKRRYIEYSKESLSRHASEIEIIEKLVERGVLRRKWKLDKCPYCDKEYWVDDLKIHNPMFCPGCHKKIPLRDKFQLGYELNELVSLSISEGIVPVILAARFLKNLTDKGFFWLPGTKCSWRSLNTDIDILACCDGHVVAVECKTLSETNIESETWNEIASQVKREVDLLKICAIKIMVFAAMCKEFPQEFMDKVLKITGNDISVLFLNKEDLMDGHRRLSFRGQQTRLMRLSDILLSQPLLRPKKR
ncbi:MAG: hypothetical protein MIO92_05055 [Methanosarcinaceae archaeon]|nr:hypothetical protein [Methanosarcinaceae archaeon]